MHGNEFAGRLDFNQYTREHYCSEILLEVQSPLRYRDKRIIYLGALNSKTPRWSSSGHDKCVHDNEFAGRLDFNQHTEGIPPLRSTAWTSTSTPKEYPRSEALLEVQSPIRYRDKCIIYLGALNSKTPRWSSSGHDKSIHDSEFAGRLDFNQHTEGIPPLRSTA